jgi:anti-anti-sigma factor
MTSSVETVDRGSRHETSPTDLAARDAQVTVRPKESVKAAVRPERRERQRPLHSVESWRHILRLEGELSHRTAQALEVEIERLCEQGVTDITIDLRGLMGIDPVGVAVIAFRWGLCERRGYGFRLIEGSTGVQREFARAGVLDLLPFCDGQTVR